jgi:hypothetical protein
MQRRRLDGTTYSSVEADGPRLQLGVAGVGGCEDGIAEPGGAGLVESLLCVDQERGDWVPVGVVCINKRGTGTQTHRPDAGEQTEVDVPDECAELACAPAEAQT